MSVPLYDADTDLFFVAGKGEATVRVYEALPATPAGYQELAPAGSDQLARGACLVPKRALDLMANEVDRVLKATATAVVPVGFYVPRARRIFHEDLPGHPLDHARHRHRRLARRQEQRPRPRKASAYR